MKIIILGAGRVGTTLAEYLCKEHDVYLVDTNEDQLQQIADRLDVQVITGAADDPLILSQVDALHADLLIAVTQNDATNIFACQLAYSIFNIPKKIARIRTPNINKFSEKLRKDLFYIDLMIDPAQLVTQRLFRTIEHPGTFIVLDLIENTTQVSSIKIDYSCAVIDQSIEEVQSLLSEVPHKLICIVRNNKIIDINKTTRLLVHDEIYFCCQKKYINQISNKVYGKELKFKRIMIGGAGNIGLKLAKNIQDDHKVKIIDHNQNQITFAAEQLSNAIVLKGDTSDSDLLNSENIDEVDLFCALTNDDENNIMSAIIAKRLGAKHTIALVNKQTYIHYLIDRSSDINIAISPRLITCSGILKYLRSEAFANDYILPEAVAEVVEIVIYENESSALIIGKKISELNIPQGCIICCVSTQANRDKNTGLIFDTQDHKLQANDHIIVFITDRSEIRILEKRFNLKESDS